MMDHNRSPYSGPGDPLSPASEGESEEERVILVVEDGTDLRYFLKRTLERRGFSVLEAGSAEEALVLAESVARPIDVLLMDIMLPDSWGTQLAEDIRMLHPQVGVILTSGHTVQDPVLGAGITQREPFLKKPFQIAELMEAISSVAGAGTPHGGDGAAP